MKYFVPALLFLFFALSVFSQKPAEVTATTTYLRKSPDYNSEKIKTLQKGEKISIEKSREASGWYFVSTDNGQLKGWIRRDAVSLDANETKPVQITVKPTEILQRQSRVAATPNSAPKSSVKTDTKIPEKKSEPTPENLTRSSTKTETTSASQTPDEDNEVLRIETAEVSLYVRVVEQNNRPVKNLRQEDFRVYEDEVLQPVTSLTVAEVPIINALVIDNSRSLRSQLTKVIEAGKILVGTNKPNDESTVVRFTSSDKIEVMQDFTPDKFLLKNALENMFVEGGQTAIIDAIYLTAERLGKYKMSESKDDAKLRTLILVSDGDDRAGKFSEQKLFDLLRRSNVQIYAVGFVNNLAETPDANGINRQEKAKDFLTRLAKETGGKVYFPNSQDELPQIAADISGEMRTQYLLSYAPTNEGGKSDLRKIRVEISDGANNQKRTAVTRSSRNILPK